MTELSSGNGAAEIARRATPGTPISLGAIIGRIEEAIDRETAAIRTDAGFDIRESNIRKSRYLYELARATKGIGEHDLMPEHREGLERLRGKLAANEQAILAHLNAVSEIASMIRTAIQKSEADGTYSAREFGQSVT